MNILIATIGTRGDVQPYLALGQALVEQGHSVTVCTHECYESLILQHGLRYAYLNDDVINFLHSDEGKAAVEIMDKPWRAIGTMLKLLPKVASLQRRGIKQLWESAEANSPDFILFHPKAVGIIDMAERLQVPCAMGFFMPLYSATGNFRAFVMPGLGVGSWYNRLTYWFLEQATWWGTKRYINDWRIQNGMPARRGRPLLTQANGQPIPALYAYSPSVVPRPSDWPTASIVSGYWFLKTDTGWEPPPKLQTFLSADEPPVYIGFGSMVRLDPQRLGRIVLGAIRNAGVRAVVATGWGALDFSGERLPDTVLEIDSVPHDWLFSRMAAVVHHGGCGTTAEGLRAGRPTVICPFFGDQPFWGKQIHEMGVGPAPIPPRKLTAANLSDAIQQATSDPSIREKADILGQTIQKEDGIHEAITFLNQWMKPPRTPS